jgi:chromosomal replication initiator protein
MTRFPESERPLPRAHPLSAEAHHDDTAIDRASSAEDAAGVFALAQRALEKKLSLFVFRGFFEPLVPISLDDALLTIGAPSRFHADWVRDHYLDEIALALRETTGERIAVAIIEHETAAQKVASLKAAEEETPSTPPTPVRAFRSGAPGASISPLRAPGPESAPQKGMRLHPAHTFDRFVCGPSNVMAFSSCKAVAEAPGQRYSPLFLFGKTGLGKTHLLHAIGNAARAQNKDLRVVYMSAEQWVNEYITEIRRQRFDEFRARYRGGCDLLLIDDIQFLAGKDASQDEFFHTFNSLYESHRQIVVTADRYPHEIDGLEQRLQTRLAWGLIADIQPPEVETRVAILEKKAETLGLVLSGDVLHFLADHIRTSVRALEGALVRLQAYAGVTKTPLTLQSAKEFLRPVLPMRDDVSIDRIMRLVCSAYDVREKDMLGASRQRQITLARQMAMYLARKHTQASLPEIGRSFARDHTTVLSSIRKIAGLVATDATTQVMIGRLENDLL